MKKSILFLFLLIFNVALAQDIATIKQQLITTYKSNPSKSTVDSALALMNASGGFTDLNYSGDTDLRVHLSRINSLASAYMNSSNLSTYYNNSTIKQKYYLSLNYWITTNQTPTNWWYRQIAYPKEVSKGFVLLADNLKVDNLSLYNSAVSYLMWGYNQNAHMDGANISDTVIGALGAAVCESDTVSLGEFRDWIDSLLLIDDTGEGFGADYMFAQHSGYGRQINTTSYGNEMYKSVLSYIEATNTTVYGVTHLSNLENGVLNAYQWITFKNHYDPSTSGRSLSSSSSIAEIVSLSDRMVALNSPQKTALTTANLRIKGANTLVGNSMFWRLDYMIHRNLNYMMSTRMTSTRTVSTESDGSSVGIYNYYSGAGANYVTVTGSEYDGSFFTNFNYRQFPGTTAEQDTATLPLIAWGQGGTNGNSFAGGVSNGTIGCSGMIWNKRKVTAYKSWFFFPDETVALGSGVTETGGTANVYTTLNQTNFNATEGVSYSKGGVVTTTKTATNFNVVAPSWFYHGSIGYANLDTSTTQSFAVNTNNSVVSIAADHGLNPSSKKYSYVILPNTTLAGMPTLVTGLAGKIVVESNTAGIQAVTHNTLHTTQIVFSTSGSLTMATGDQITVNSPCALILDRVAGKIYVSNPRAESAGTSVLVTYLKDGVTASSTVVFPTGNLSGSTVNFTITPMTTTGSETVSACGTSYTWPLNGQSYNASGSYEYVVGNNIATLTLTLTPNTTVGSQSVSACGTSYTWPLNGQSYTSSGTYTHVVECNTATLELTLTPNTTVGSQSVSACGTSYTWPLNSQSYTASGTYTHVVGCNTATLTLTLTPNTTDGSQSVSACGTSYTWPLNGQSYTSSGTYTHVVGCNTATLTLTLTPNTTVGSQSVSACGTSYTWPLNGQSYTSPGTYTYVEGCNTATLTLTFTPSTTVGNQTVSTCGASYIWPLNGQSYTSSGTYTHVVGCNTATLTLTLTPKTTVGSQTVSVCGTYYTWPLNGQSYTSSGTYTRVVGCNTATLILTLTPITTDGSQSVSACGTSYTWPLNGQSYTASGTYTHVVGCNTATLTLTLTPATNHTTTVSAFNNYTWANSGQTYTTGGIKTGTTTNCVTELLDLTITTTQTIALCAGATVASATNSTSLKYYKDDLLKTVAPLAATTKLVSGTTYFVTDVVNGVESARVPVLVNLTALIAPTAIATSEAKVICKYIGTDKLVTFTATATGATSYSWTLPTGASIVGDSSGASVQVSFAGVTATAGAIGSVIVDSNNALGCPSAKPKVLALTTKAASAPKSVVLTYNGTIVKKAGNFVGDASKKLTLTVTDPSLTADHYDFSLPEGVSDVIGATSVEGSTTLYTAPYTGTSTVLTFNLGGVAASKTVLAFNATAVAGCGSASKTLSVDRAEAGTPKGLVLSDATLADINAIPPVIPIVLKKLDSYTGSLKIRKLTLTTTPNVTAGSEATSYKWVLPVAATIVDDSATPYVENLVVVPNTFTSISPSISINLANVADQTSFVFKVYGVNGNGTSLLSKDLTCTSAAPKAPAAIYRGVTGSGIAFTTYSTSCGTVILSVPKIFGVVNSFSTSEQGVVIGEVVDNTVSIDFTNAPSALKSTVVITAIATTATGSNSKAFTIKLGACAGSRIAAEEVIAVDEFNVIAYPNPSSSEFTIDVQSSNKGTTGVQVYDMAGRLIENRQVNANSIEIGRNYASGIYNVIVNQGAKVKTLRVIKQ